MMDDHPDDPMKMLAALLLISVAVLMGTSKSRGYADRLSGCRFTML
jgi:hypothetical protein